MNTHKGLYAWMFIISLFLIIIIITVIMKTITLYCVLILSQEPWKHFVISVDSYNYPTRQILLSKLREVKVIIQGQTAGKSWSQNLNLRGLTPKLTICQKTILSALYSHPHLHLTANPRSKPFLPHFTRKETGT